MKLNGAIKTSTIKSSAQLKKVMGKPADYSSILAKHPIGHNK